MTFAKPLWRERIEALVRTPSVSSVRPEFDMSNKPVIDLLAEWMEHEGFSVEVLPIDHEPGKFNILATLGSGPPGLVLSGHTDTVPFDEGKWSSDPFVVTEREGKLFGLGTADMKSFFALALEAARNVSAQSLSRSLVILGTADEECGMVGIRAIEQLQRALGTQAIIGEPTDLRPIRMHKGVSMEYLRLIGRSGHSSVPSLGANALEGMRRAMNAIVRERERLEAALVRPDLVPSTMTLNLGSIRGGDNPNRICGECELQYDLRLLPGMEYEEVQADLRRAVEEAIVGLGLDLQSGSFHPPVPPFETSSDAPLVRALEELTGCASGAVSFGTEAPFLSRMGIETVVLGPGDIAVAHQPNEFVPLDRSTAYIDLLARTIDRVCGPESKP